VTAFVCYGQFLTTMSATGSQYATTVGGSHSLKETVFVATLALRRLECTFHLFSFGFLGPV
jgi:hypothetical protein